jgi:hypothetical protein
LIFRHLSLLLSVSQPSITSRSSSLMGFLETYGRGSWRNEAPRFRVPPSEPGQWS